MAKKVVYKGFQGASQPRGRVSVPRIKTLRLKPMLRKGK